MHPEELLNLMRSRRSVRRFLDRAPPLEVLEQLLEAARWAPSNHNRQGWRFIVFQDPGEIRKLAREVRAGLSDRIRKASPLVSQLAGELVHHASWFESAPCVILVLHKMPVSVSAELLEGVPHPEMVSGEPLSAAMAVQNLLLAAHAVGLGTCVLTAPLMVPEAFSKLPDLPSGFEPTCLVAVGYPAESPEAPRRKKLEQIAEFRGQP